MPGRCLPVSAANLRAGEDSNDFHHGCVFEGDNRLVTLGKMPLLVFAGDLLRVGDRCTRFGEVSHAVPSLNSR